MMSRYGFEFSVVILLVIILQFLAPESKANKQVHGHFTKQTKMGNPDNLLFDISEYIDNVRDNGTDNFDQRLVLKDLHTSSFMYYRKAPRNLSDLPPNFAKYFKEGLRLFNGSDMPEIGIIFRESYTSSLPAFLSSNSVDHYPDILVIQGNDTKSCPIYCSDVLHNYHPLTNITGADNVKVGHETNAKLFDCVNKYCPTYYSMYDVIIFYEQFSPVTSILSYGLFEDKMRKIMAVKGEITNGRIIQFYIRISMSESIGLSDSEKDLYRTFLRDYAQAYFKFDNSAKFIVDTYPVSLSNIPLTKAKYQNIYPVVSFNTPGKNSKDSIDDICDLKNRLRIACPHFKTVVVEMSSLFHDVFSPPTTCNKSSYSHSERYDHLPLPYLILTGTMQVQQLCDAVEIFQDNFDDITITRTYFHPIYIDHGMMPNITVRGMPIGCQQFSHHDVTDYSDKMSDVPKPNQECYGHIDEIRPMLYIYLMPQPHNIDDVGTTLNYTLRLRQDFRTKYPQGDIVFHVIVRYVNIGRNNFRVNVFCSDYLKGTAELNEVIMTWSFIHNVTVVLQPLIDSVGNSGLWFNIVTEPDLNRTISDFYVLVSRNGAAATHKEHELPNTFQCVSFTEQLSAAMHSANRFVSNLFSGITVKVSFESIGGSVKDNLQTMFCFVFGRFTSAEIIGDSDNVKYISDAMTKKLQGALPATAHWYTELNASHSFEANFKMLAGSAFHPSGIHIRGWDGPTSELNAVVNKLFQDNPNFVTNLPALGITVRSCTHEINSGLSNIKSLDFISQVSYIVCDSRIAPASNADKKAMQLYLDTNYYIQQYFNHTLGLDTFFRLSFAPLLAPMVSTEVVNYLRLLTDINQHSEIYKIRYFMGNAFDSADSKRWSWWRISDYTDLANPTVYTEMESEYFGRPTEQKYKVPPENEIIVKKGSTSLATGLIVTSIILVCALFCLIIRQRFSIESIMTRDEIAAFRDGAEIQRSEEPIGVSYVRVNTVKILGFNKKFEIPKASINLVTLIGEGHFGIVYDGVLNKSRRVAVKIPHPNCSKESLQSILAEIKILCYIGSHKNVLLFVGAYTKEIGKGIVYVLTEFCDNGSLETYLRTLKTNELTETVSTTNIGYMTADTLSGVAASRWKYVGTEELHKFACEIACGMAYISEKNVVHGDLSTRNVLLTGNMTCKIGDFGLSRRLYERSEYVRKGNEALPWRWMALESLKEMQFTTMSDVWSFGVTLWEIYSLGDMPYPGVLWTHKFPNFLESGLRVSKPKLASADIYGKMLECCDISPLKRPTFDDLSKYFESFYS